MTVRHSFRNVDEALVGGASEEEGGVAEGCDEWAVYEHVGEAQQFAHVLCSALHDFFESKAGVAPYGVAGFFYLFCKWHNGLC